VLWGRANRFSRREIIERGKPGLDASVMMWGVAVLPRFMIPAKK
jgi:hypothetical protein